MYTTDEPSPEIKDIIVLDDIMTDIGLGPYHY